ncbi:MAG TPA: SHOCT domain-containing protein, partial [Gaiellaceae bacterium]
GVYALRRESLLEFPDASIADDDSVQAHLVRSPAGEIAQLRDLRDSGAITDAEFERGKKLALSRDG